MKLYRVKVNGKVYEVELEAVSEVSGSIAAPVAQEEESAGSGVKTVVLKDAGAQKLQVIKVIREATGLGLKEAKDIADAGGNVKEGIPASEAEELKAKLEEAGATVELA